MNITSLHKHRQTLVSVNQQHCRKTFNNIVGKIVGSGHNSVHPILVKVCGLLN